MKNNVKNNKKNNTTYIIEEEKKIRDKIVTVFDLLIQELNQTINSDFDDDLDKEIIELHKLQNEIESRINRNLKSSIFNFTKSLFSKDLRRNISYFQIILQIKEISNLTVEIDENVLLLKNNYNFFENKYRRSMVIGTTNNLISFLNDLKNLILNESIDSSKKLYKEAKILKNTNKNSFNGFDWNSSKLENLDEQDKKEVLYKYFLIIKNLDIILSKVIEISKFIYYIQTGSF